MSTEPNQLAHAEQPTASATVVEGSNALITIEPKKYVELVFEPFAKQFEAAKLAVRDASYDVATTAGMAVAIKHRAAFREIRVGSEKARKLRKAPILEIGKLLDSRQGEIEAAALPLETLFDEEIKAEEARKEAIKVEAARQEREKQEKIQAEIDAIKAVILTVAGKSAAEIDAAQVKLDFREITLEQFGKRTGEAMKAKADTLARLSEMHAEATEREEAAIRAAQQAQAERLERERIAAEQKAEADRLAALAREIEERERVASAERAAREAADRAAREKEEAERTAEQNRIQAKRAAEQAAHDARIAEQQAELDRQQAEAARLAAAASEIKGIQQQAIIAVSGRAGVRAGGTIQCIRETLAETEAWPIDPDRFGLLADAAQSAKTTVNAEIRQLLAAAEEQEATAKAEAERVERERKEALAREAAAEAERQRRARVQFELNGPGDTEIVRVLAEHFEVTADVARSWVLKFGSEVSKAA